jgi:methionyl-tRNA synthetase
LVALADAANQYIERTRPWDARGDIDGAGAVLAPLLGVVRVIGRELEVFAPALAGRVEERVGADGEPVTPGPPVYPRLECVAQAAGTLSG